MKKANKAAAKQWHEDQKQAENNKEYLINEICAVHYAGNKDRHLSSECHREMGYADAADKIDQAKQLLREASDLMDGVIDKLRD